MARATGNERLTETGTGKDGQSGARVYGILLSHAKELEPLATGGSQSRVSGERREPTLRGDLVTRRVVGSGRTLREDLLRA
jgi:hypothetical protein